MSKVRVVVQEERGCRVLINPNPQEYAGKSHLVNPDTDSVRGTSPETWFILDGKLISSHKPKLPPIEFRNEAAIRAQIENLSHVSHNRDTRMRSEVQSSLKSFQYKLKQLKLWVIINSCIAILVLVALIAH